MADREEILKIIRGEFIMKKVWKILAVSICASTIAFPLSACRRESAAFGQFSQNGYRLTSFATREISIGEAQSLLAGGSAQARSVAYLPEPAPTNEKAVNALIQYSNEIIVTTKFFKEGSEEMQEEISDQAGTAVGNFLNANAISTGTGLTVRNLYVSTDVLKFMEEENRKFKESDGFANVPFSNLYTYHTDDEKHLIVQMHDFVDIPASALGGGINCYYRQDTEIMYDIITAEDLSSCYGRIRKWQTSLGAVISTSSNSIQEGYIYQVEVEWIERN